MLMEVHWRFGFPKAQRGLAFNAMPRSFKIEDHIPEHLSGIQPYVPGIQPDDRDWIKLNTNENPFPPSPRVASAIIEALGQGGDGLRRYPNPNSSALREALAAYHTVDFDQVIIGNGSDEILSLLVRCFSDSRHAVGFCVPSYSVYPVLARAHGAACVEIPFDRAFSLNTDGIADCGGSIFFLTAPNAPSGVGFTNEAIAAVLERFPGLLVVDEAYVAFAEEDTLQLLDSYPNLCIVRTFSKSHSLAGLRVGYALATSSVVRLLDAVRDSYNLDQLAQVGALAALGDPEYYKATIGKILSIRDSHTSEFRRRGWFTYDSQANFIFTEPVDASGRKGPGVARSLYAYLKERRILVRYFGEHPLTCSFLRITVGDECVMQRLSEALASWLKSV